MSEIADQQAADALVQQRIQEAMHAAAAAEAAAARAAELQGGTR
ncbi:hypothetical protein [Streptomyces natalensis]|nr:hypothetical protein [Streptomyces natalensis]